MKKSLLNQRNLLKVFCSLCFVLLFVNVSWGQQIIGSFPTMDGGFEGQASSGAISSTSYATGFQSLVWTTSSSTMGTFLTSSPRTGGKYVNLNFTSTNKRFQSPTAALNAINAGSSYTVQFYYRTSGTTAPGGTLNQSGTSADGTSPTSITYTTHTAFTGTSGSWAKVTGTITAATGTGTTQYGYLCAFRTTTAMAAAIDIDDVVMYPGTNADVTLPDPATLPIISSVAATQQTISWTAAAVGAGNGVDGGGYMVVRSTADPATAPNANGIYAVGNFVAGTEKVVYLGTTPSFNDTGLSASTQYFYRIYSVDKAFNYSTAVSVNGTTSAPSFAAEPTTQASAITFSSVSSTGMTINWTAGNGSNSLVVVKEGSAVDATPSDGNSLSPNLVFGNGTLLGTGNYVVYNSTGTSVSITGLLKARTYYVKVYTFNGSAGSENYLLTSPPSKSQFTPPGEISSAGTSLTSTSYSTGSAWLGGVAPGQYDNVTIVNGDIINLGSTQKCYNLTVNSGGKIQSTSGQTLQIYGTSLACEGTFGDVSNVVTTGSQLTTEFGNNLTISGAGGIYPYKLRPVAGLTNIGVTFNANTDITAGTGTGILSNTDTLNDNITYTLNTGKTLTVRSTWAMTSSTGTAGAGNTTITIDGTCTIGNAFATPVVSGKTFTANINGTLAVTGTSSLFGLTGGGVATINVNGTYTSTGNLSVTPIATSFVAPVINVGSSGVLTVNGTADFSNPSLVGYIGNTPTTTGGRFTLGATGTIKLVNTSGLEPNAGPIRTTNRTFPGTASYWFSGTSAQVLGSDFPALVNGLTVNNAAGLTLGANTTVSGILSLTAGTLTTGANTLTLGGTPTITAGSTIDASNAGATVTFANSLSPVVLPAVTPLFTGNVQNLTINGAGGVTLGTATSLAGKLSVTSGVLTTGGFLTLKSTDCCTAYVGQLADGAVTGLVTVERYIPAKRAWRALTAPLKASVADASIFSQWQNNGTLTTGTGVELWGPGGTGSSGNGLTAGPNSSILQYDNTGSIGTWSGVTDTNATKLFTTSRNNAFMVFPTGQYGSNSIASSTTALATTLKATGQLIIGDVPYTNLPILSHTLIGNPYASPLNLTAMLADNLLFGGNIWVWDANATGLNSVGTFNLFSSGTYTNATSNPVVTSGTQIQSGQAFFVLPTVNLSTFTIKESHKGSTFSNAVLRTATPELLRVGLYKQINSEWSGRDGAMTVILPDAEANQTPNKMVNGTENIAFTKNSGLFASNHHLPLVASDVLNVKVWNTTAGANYKLKIYTEQFATTSLDATLEDLFTNARTPLTLDGSAVEYPFAVTTEAASTGNRFRIVFQTAALGINNPKANGFSVLPNPVTGDSFQVNLGILATGTYSYSICNALGQEVEKGSINNVAQNTNYEVKMSNGAAGIYIMKIKGTDNSVFTAKIIKK